MELTPEQSQQMITDRLREYPDISKLVSLPTFRQGLQDIVTFEEINPALIPTIENNLMVVLTFYAPLSELAQNMSEDTGLPIEKMKELVIMIDAILLTDIHDELAAFDYLWKEEMKKETPSAAAIETKERLELRPDGATNPLVVPTSSSPTPLTREELLRALAGKRTMAGDIKSVRQKEPEDPTVGSSNG